MFRVPVVFSNVASCVRRECWMEIPFREDLSSTEDLYWAESVLAHNCGSVEYCPAAVVLHSHCEELGQVRQRVFGIPFPEFIGVYWIALDSQRSAWRCFFIGELAVPRHSRVGAACAPVFIITRAGG